MNFGVQQLQETLEKEGYRVLLSGIEDTLTEADRIIFLNQACDSTLRKRDFDYNRGKQDNGSGE